MGVVIHQALHGYSDGHRQFACSAELAVTDARQVLVMSDASGAGVTAEGVSYLTGYPLQASGLYALARTWPALEMPRPGCVWTHTLFIEFADLSILDSPSQMDRHFRKPSVETARSYASSLLLPEELEAHRPLLASQVPLFERIASALYEHPTAQVWTQRTGEAAVDEVVLRLWDLQWPRLRRSFRFCTLTTRDRSQEGSLFDLQISAGSVPRLRFAHDADGIEAKSASCEPWLNQLVDYAQMPAASGFREVLRLLGTDVLGGREAMRSICGLQADLVRPGPSALVSAVALVNSTLPLSSSKVAKGMVANVVLARVDEASPDALEFLVEHLDLIEERALNEHSPELAVTLCAANPSALVDLLDDDRQSVRSSMNAAVGAIDAQVLIQRLDAGADWTWKLLAARPDLTQSAEFWRRTQAQASDIDKAGIGLRLEVQIVPAILGLTSPESIESIARAAGARAVLDSLQHLALEMQDLPLAQIWVREACVQVGDVAGFLADCQAPQPQLLLAIASELGPDAVPNDYGVDPWFAALAAVHAKANGLPLELLVYGCRRALGWRSKSAGPLLRLTFDALHRAATVDSLAGSLGEQLRNSLPWVPPADAWDTALRLRLAATKRCVEAHVPADDFVALTSNDDLFATLLVQTWTQWGGKRYLKTVDEVLSHTPHAGQAARSQQLKAFIEQNSRGWWS